MKKANIRVDPSKCAECLSCQLVCSLIYTGIFNPSKARLKVEPGKISFTDECIENCHLCAHYCAYGALTVLRSEALVGEK